MDTNEERLCENCGARMLESQYLSKDGAKYYYCSDYRDGCHYQELEDGTPLNGYNNYYD